MATRRLGSNPLAQTGVDFLIQNTKQSGEVVQTLNVHNIVTRNEQPRKIFDKLEELALSIEEKGLISPLVVRQTEHGLYEIVAGERRFRAIKEFTEIKEVMCIVKKCSDEEVREISLIENLQREDINPIEEATAILDLLDIKIKQVCTDKTAINVLHAMHNEKVTRSATGSDIVVKVFSWLGQNWRSYYRNKLPLLTMPNDVQQAIIEYENFTPSHAREIVKIKDESERKKIIDEIVTDNLSSRAVKEKISQSDKPAKKKESQKTETITFDDFPSLKVKKKKQTLEFSITSKQQEQLVQTLEFLLEKAKDGLL